MHKSAAISRLCFAISSAESFVSLNALAAAKAKLPPEPIAIRPSLGSKTSPVPLRIKLVSLSATSIIASSLLKYLSVLQSFANSTQALIKLFECLSNFDSNLSIKPTAFGLLLDREVGMDNIEALVSMANEHQMFVRLDMEDHRVTDDTIQVMLDMHEKGLTNVGVVLQARLFRTIEDIQSIAQKLGKNADYRICKGIYLEPEEISHTDRQPIIKATNDCVDAMLDAGAYVGIASHDHPVINHTLEALSKRKMGPGITDPRPNAGEPRPQKGPGYEFQMLLGVRGPLRRKLCAKGHRTRVYIPYGEKWYEYSIRRLKENPTIGTQVAKAFLMPWTNRP